MPTAYGGRFVWEENRNDFRGRTEKNTGNDCQKFWKFQDFLGHKSKFRTRKISTDVSGWCMFYLAIMRELPLHAKFVGIVSPSLDEINKFCGKYEWARSQENGIAKPDFALNTWDGSIRPLFVLPRAFRPKIAGVPVKRGMWFP